jgi:hypothetical protein
MEQQNTVTGNANAEQAKRQMPKEMKSFWMCAVVVVLIVVLLAALIVGKSAYRARQADKDINTDTYQIVTLTSGRSYFGKLSGLGNEYASIENTFYLQAKTPQVDESGNAIENPADDGLPFTLQPIRNQVYQPEAPMSIRASDISNWQNLSKDSAVAKAIDEYLVQQ